MLMIRRAPALLIISIHQSIHTAMKAQVVLEGEAEVVDVIQHAQYSKLGLLLKPVEMRTSLVTIVSASPRFDITKVATTLIALKYKIDRLIAGAVVHAGK